MDKLDWNTIRQEIGQINMRRSPELRHLPAELNSCADILLKDLVGWTNRRFMLAVQEHRNHSNYVPTTFDLRKADAAISRPEPERIPLPPGDGEIEAQFATNKKWLARWFEKIGRDKRIPA